MGYHKIIRCIFLSFSIVLLSTSCKQLVEDDTNRKTLNYSLLATDTISIILDGFIDSRDKFTMDIIDGDEYICHLRKETNTYHLYGLNKSNRRVKIRFLEHGPIGLGKIQYIKVYDWDSIFIISSNSKVVIITDSAERKINAIQFENILSHNKLLFVSATKDFPLVYQDKKIFLQAIPPIKPFTLPYWNTNMGLIYHTISGSSFNLTGFFPNVYKQGFSFGLYNYKASRVVTKSNQEVYSFSMSNNLFVYQDTSFIARYDLPSYHIKNDAPMPKIVLNGNNHPDDWEYEINRGSFRQLVYDSKLDIIYRIVTKATVAYDQDGNRNSVLNKAFSIQIINNKFELIGEVDFAAKQYDYRNVFASKKGLLVALSDNEQRKSLKNHLKYAIFSLVEINKKSH